MKKYYMTKEKVMERYAEISESTINGLLQSHAFKMEKLYVNGKFVNNCVNIKELEEFENSRRMFPEEQFEPFMPNVKYVSSDTALNMLGYSQNTKLYSVGNKYLKMLNPLNTGTKGKGYWKIRIDKIQNVQGIKNIETEESIELFAENNEESFNSCGEYERKRGLKRNSVWNARVCEPKIDELINQCKTGEDGGWILNSDTVKVLDEYMRSIGKLPPLRTEPKEEFTQTEVELDKPKQDEPMEELKSMLPKLKALLTMFEEKQEGKHVQD